MNLVARHRAAQAEVFDAAMKYVAAGISVVPIKPDGSKQPAYLLLPKEVTSSGREKHSWRIFQRRSPSESELRHWFLHWGPVCGVAVVCGVVSGGLEVIDFDTIDVAQPWADLVAAEVPGLLDRLVIVESPRPGRHVYFRSEAAEGNQKLAQVPVFDDDTGLSSPQTLIETRGEGGYVLVPPSPGHCHPSGRQYHYASPHNLCYVPTITLDERAVLITAAQSFNVAPPAPRRSSPNRRPPSLGHRGFRPGDDFDARAAWDQLLETHGWTFVGSDGGVEYWRRPGKSEGVSATVNHAGVGLLHVFTSNASPLEPDTSYSKFAFFTLTEHDGDYTAAARDLQSQGYGQPQRSPVRQRRRGRGRHRSR